MKGCDHLLTTTSTGWVWFWPLRYWVRCYRCELRRGPYASRETCQAFVWRYEDLSRRWRRAAGQICKVL